jgi:UDP-glucose 4-epimerase
VIIILTRVMLNEWNEEDHFYKKMDVLMKEKISKAIVTGGAGFIGSHLVEALVSRGVETYVIDDLSTGSISNISHLLDKQKGSHAKCGIGRLHLIIGDMRNIHTLLNHVTDIDIIFHEAAIANVIKSIDDPIGVNDINVVCTLKVLDFALKRGIPKFLFASSAAVYGEIPTTASSASEDMFCVPLSPYGASKVASEAYLRAFEKVYGIQTTILRYANVYGPRQSFGNYSGVIPIFINDIFRRKIPIIYGDGFQVRDFVHVLDIVYACLLAAEADGVSGETFNAGSGMAISINHLLITLSRILFPGSEPLHAEYLPSKAGDMRKGMMSIEKIKRKLGYCPSVSLESGLSDLLRYYGNVNRMDLVVKK